MRYYTYSSYLTGLVWALLAFVTLWGITLSTIGWAINVIAAVLFLLIGCFFYFRASSFQKFVKTLTLTEPSQKFLQTTLLLDKLFVSVSLLISILFLSGAVVRVFIEKFPVFG